MAEPKRIQMSRQHPWRAENPDAVIVDRRTIYGNPFEVGASATANGTDARGLGYCATITLTRANVIEMYREHIEVMLIDDPRDFPEDRAVTAEWKARIEALRGHDLACWCQLDQPCHADVLLELANVTEEGPR